MKLTIEVDYDGNETELEFILAGLVARSNALSMGPYNLYDSKGALVGEARLGNVELNDDERDYAALIERVRALDPDAARYMETEARTLESFTPHGALDSCFIWDEATQGHSYWGDIEGRLKGFES